MNDELTIIPTVAQQTLSPRVTITTRLATMDDIPFMDGLMKQYNRQLGFFPTAQLEGYVKGGWMLIAQDATTGQRLGFCASRDRYLKRDELGIIYLLCVVPGNQRKLIGASLIKAVFERSAYGCKLYCCWCAQDIAANYFWESLGFAPIAFRAGSSGKKRVHIFWQRSIDDGDTTTKYWYPFQTNSGAIRQDRLVFPIPPGVRWQDVRAVAAPEAKDEDRGSRIEDRADGSSSLSLRSSTLDPRSAPITAKPKKAKSVAQEPDRVPPGKVAIFVGGKIRYVDRPGYVAPAPTPVEKRRATKATKPHPPKFDPTFLAAARELRDRYLEQMNRDGLMLPPAKHDVSRRAIAGKVESLSATPASGIESSGPLLVAASTTRANVSRSDEASSSSGASGDPCRSADTSASPSWRKECRACA